MVFLGLPTFRLPDPAILDFTNDEAASTTTGARALAAVLANELIIPFPTLFTPGLRPRFLSPIPRTSAPLEIKPLISPTHPAPDFFEGLPLRVLSP